MAGESDKSIVFSYRYSEVFAIFALGFYWGWIHLIFFVPFGSFYGGSEIDTWLFLAPAGFVLCCIAFEFGVKLDTLANNKPVVTVATALAVFGTFLILESTSAVSLVIGVVCASILGPTCIFVFNGALSKRFHPDKTQPRICFLAMIVSFFVYLAGYSLPASLTSAICLVLPVLSVILFNRAYVATDNLSTSWDTEPRNEVKSRLPIPLVFILYIVVFSLSLNYLVGNLSAGLRGELSNVDNLRCILYAFGIIICVVLVELFTERRGVTVAPFVIAALSTVALLLWVVGGADAAVAALPMSIAGYFLFVPVFYLKAGQTIAVSDNSPSRVLNLAIACNMLGLALGSSLSYLSATSLPVVSSIVVACMICAFFVLSFFVLPQKTTESLLVWAGVIAHDEVNRKGNALASEMIRAIENQAEIAGVHFDLTPRETEILCYLLRGWELQSIAKEENLSRNTVKTHVTHIYQKLGAHTREECSMIIERLSVSSDKKSDLP